MLRRPSPGSKLDKYKTLLLRWKSEGLSDRQIAAQLKSEYGEKVSYRTVNHWFNTHPEPSGNDQAPVPPASREGNKSPIPAAAKLESARALPETSADLLTHIIDLEDRLTTLQENKPAATVPALSWGTLPGLRDEPRRFSPSRTRRLGSVVLLALLGVTLYGLYGLVADNPIVSAVVSFLASPIRSSQRLYAQLTASPIAMIMTAVILSGLALGYRWKTAVLATVVWFMHLSIERSDFVTFTVLLLLCGRLSAAMLRRAERAHT